MPPEVKNEVIQQLEMLRDNRRDVLPPEEINHYKMAIFSIKKDKYLGSEEEFIKVVDYFNEIKFLNPENTAILLTAEYLNQLLLIYHFS